MDCLAALAQGRLWHRESPRMSALAPLAGVNWTFLTQSETDAADPKRSFGSIHATCLSALVTDRVMEA